MSAVKGSRYERELIERLGEAGFFALKAPASGSATTRNLPDVLAIMKEAESVTALWGIEIKAGNQTTLYVDEEEVEALSTLHTKHGISSFLAARFTMRSAPTHTYLVRPGAARRTDSGAYGLPVSDIEERASYVLTEDGLNVPQ